jgi:hypothetical protein
MQKFRIFYFRKNVLHYSEELQVRDILDAVDLARGTEPDVRAEIWSERGKVGEIGTRGGLS